MTTRKPPAAVKIARGTRSVRSMAAMSFHKKAEAALAAAKKLAADNTNWVDANNKLYSIGGILTQLFPSIDERRKFIDTKQSDEIQTILEKLPEPKARIGRPRQDVNGKILVRVPKSLHAALLAEAEAEGVSLNQLIVSKLSLRLRAAV